LINHELMRKILTSFAVFPAFIDLLQSFGQKSNFEDESYSGLRFQENKLSNCFG
jgi:hypothetical protein